MVIPVAIIRRKKIIKGFIDCGAVSPETAKTPEEAGVLRAFGGMFSRLESEGILKSCGNNRYYINVDRV